MSQPAPRLDDLRIERDAKPDAPRPAGRWIILAVALAIAAAAVWWWLGRAQAMPVRVAVARELTSSASDRTVLNASGYVTARREATVSSKVIGKITEVLVEEGISVKADQVLARLDASNVQGALALARAQAAAAQAALEETRVRLREAELDLARQTTLSKTNVAARAEFDRADAAAQAWRARLAQQQAEQVVAERNVAVHQQQLDDTIIRAPFGALASAELFVIINLPKRSTGLDANVPLRGIEGPATQVRDAFTIESGRMFTLGKNEVIVGRGAAREFAGLDVGATIKVGREQWPIVGVFSANHGIAESEIWTDAKVLQSAFQRGDSFQSVSVRLASAESFTPFKDALTTNPQLNVKVARQSEYYAGQSTVLTTLITKVGLMITALMAIGAVFGALNTMYSAIASRTREIATLRALGFGSGAIVTAVMIESLVVAFVGGVAGGAAAYAAFNNFQTSTMNWQSFSQVTFAFSVTPALLHQGIIWALAIGLLGGLFPAIRAARQPIAAALREL